MREEGGTLPTNGLDVPLLVRASSAKGRVSDSFTHRAGCSLTLGAIVMEVFFAWFLAVYTAKAFEYLSDTDMDDSSDFSIPASKYLIPAMVCAGANLLIDVTAVTPAEDTHDLLIGKSIETVSDENKLNDSQKKAAKFIYYSITPSLFAGNYFWLSLSDADQFRDSMDKYIPMAALSAVLGCWYYHMLTDGETKKHAVALASFNPFDGSLDVRDVFRRMDIVISNIIPNTLYRTISSGFIVANMDFLGDAKMSVFGFSVAATFITTLMSRTLPALQLLDVSVDRSHQVINLLSRVVLLGAIGYLGNSSDYLGGSNLLNMAACCALYLAVTVPGQYFGYRMSEEANAEAEVNASANASGYLPTIQEVELQTTKVEDQLNLLKATNAKDNPSFLIVANICNIVARLTRALSFIYSWHHVVEYVENNWSDCPVTLTIGQTIAWSIIMSVALVVNELPFYGEKIKEVWAQLLVKKQCIDESSEVTSRGGKLYSFFFDPILGGDFDHDLDTLAKRISSKASQP